MTMTILLRVFETILKTSIGMIPFLAVLLLLENKFRKYYSTAWKYTIFLMVLVRLLIPVCTGKNQNLIIENIVHIPQNIIHIPKQQYTTNIQIENIEQTNTSVAKQNTKVSKTKQYHLFQKQNVMSLLSCIWLTVVTAKLLYLFAQYIQYCKRVVRWRKLPIQQYTMQIYHNICCDMNIKNIPRLFVCDVIDSPMCLGIFQKGIYITNEQSKHLYMILKHELCHYKRNDVLYQLLCVLVDSIHFFNPFVNIFVKMAERNIELYCDDTVMENCSMSQRKEYSMMILSSINENMYQNTVLSADLVKQKDILKNRFQNILCSTPKKNGKLLLIAFTILYVLSFYLSIFAFMQQLTLLFCLFNLFILFSFCFVISTKQNNNKTVCALFALFIATNVLITGCHANLKQSTQQQTQYITEAENLFKWKTDTVGDNTAVGNILSILGTPDGMVSNGFEIQSNTEPYGIKLYYTIEDLSKVESEQGTRINDSDIIINDDVEFQFRKSIMVLLSLIKNLYSIEYHVNYSNEEILTFCATRDSMIKYDYAVQLIDEVLEGYTDSAESYQYFLDDVYDMKTVNLSGYQPWQKEVDDALHSVVYNDNIAFHSDVESYIKYAPNDSYNIMVEKGEKTLNYFLKRFKEGTAKGLQGQIMMRVCQDILEQYGLKDIKKTDMSPEEWYEYYQSKYDGYYPYYSSIIENINDEYIIHNHYKEVFTELQKKRGGKHITILSMIMDSPLEGHMHEYKQGTKVNYYARLKYNYFTVLKQKRGNVLCLKYSTVEPVKIVFQQSPQGNMELDTIIIERDIDRLCAEDKNMIPILKQQYTQIQQKNFDNELEKNIKKYISKNDIDVKYIYIDKNRINSFENIGESIEK